MKYSSIFHIIFHNEQGFLCLDQILIKFNSIGFTITIIHSEKEFKPLIYKVEDLLDVTMNYSNPGEHVTEIYLNTRIVKE